MANVQEARKILQTLSREDKTTFINNFNVLDSDEKRSVAVNRLVNRFGAKPEKLEERTGGLFGSVPTKDFERGERNIAGDIIERPAAAVRGGLLSTGRGEGFLKGFRKGAIRPGTIPSAEEIGAEKAAEVAGRLPRPLAKPAGFILSTQAQALGTGVSIATNPFELLLMLAGKAPGAEKVASFLGKTPPVQAVGRFLTKPRGVAGRGILRKGIRAARKFKGQPKAGIPAKSTRPITKTVEDQINASQKTRNLLIQKTKDATTKKALQSANRIDDEVLRMTADLQDSAEKGTLEFQKRIPKSQRAASNEYGRILDDISDDLVARNEGITNGEMRSTIIDTLGDMQQMGLPESRVQTVLQNTLNKYPIEQIDDVVRLKDALTDVKSIRGQVSAGVQSGTKPFSDTELGTIIFNNKWGQILETKAPALKDLNKAYAPVIRVNKLAHKIFKPRAGELQTKAGTGLLTKAAKKQVIKGKISPVKSLERGERELIRILEEGTEFAPGIGKVSEPTKRIGERIAGREVAKVKAKETITKLGKKEAEKVGRQFDKRLNQLSVREEKVEKLLRDKAKVNQIRRLVVTGVVTTSIAIGAIRSFLGLKHAVSGK